MMLTNFLGGFALRHIEVLVMACTAACHMAAKRLRRHRCRVFLLHGAVGGVAC